MATGRGLLFNFPIDSQERAAASVGDSGGASTKDSGGASTKDSGGASTKDSGGVSAKDSGVVIATSSTQPAKRPGRGKLLENLAASMSSLGVGSLGSDPSSSADHAETVSAPLATTRGHGRGRAQIFQSLMQSSSPQQTADDADSPSPSVAGSSTRLTVPSESDQAKDPTYYMPDTVYGSRGDQLRMACNYINLVLDPSKGVFLYDVRFKPPIDSISLRMKLLNQHRERIGVKVFDGQKLLLPTRLESQAITLKSRDEVANKDIEIRIEFKRSECLRECMHLYNVLFDRVMKTLSYVRFGRKQFNPSEAKILPQAKLEVWPGYVTAVDEYDGGLMLCCDVSHRVLCQKTVLEILAETHRMGPAHFQDNAKKSLLGSVVITRYNDRTYRIDDIRFDMNPMSKFQASKSGEITYYEYYRRAHNIEIKDKTQPLLLSIKKQTKYNQKPTEDLVFCLVPEICFLTGLRDEMRNDFRLMRELASFTKVTPNQRLMALDKFYKNVNSNSQASEILKAWGLSLAKGVHELQGRVLEEEQIFLAKSQFGVGPQADFGKHVMNNELLEVVHLRNWILLHCKGDMRTANNFWELYDRCSRTLGIEVRKPRFIVLESDRSDAYVNALRKNIDEHTQMVVCICPSSRDDRYSAIKRICCSEIPTPSQVINARTLANESKNRSIVQKIALQINCKLGGSLWAIKIPFKSVMICGVDSYHDVGEKGKSVAGFVASLNAKYTKWYSKAIIQEKREEIVKGMCSALTASLFAYEKDNGKIPEKIILYRDGVGDGQFQYCNGFEIPQLEAACRLAYPNSQIQITFIIVQKRINARFFGMKDGFNAENPPPGSIVDSQITRANMYDFFLVSQCSRQGTVTPTHFVVLRDDSGYKPDILQRLSYKMCFLYYNWPGSIRVPACCQYAHKMAGLVGQSIRRVPAEELATKLYYL